MKLLTVLIIVFSLNLKFETYAQGQRDMSLINTAHLDHLYQKIKVGGKEMGIVHIYSDYPDYHYVEAKGEGIACVDDAARALVFYIKYYGTVRSEQIIEKIKMLTNFLLYMQASSGFYYNFIWNDYSIDTTYRTSVAEPNWWTWRAIWALSESQMLFMKVDKKIAEDIKQKLKRSVDVTLGWLRNSDNDSTSNYNGFNLPNWLPYGTAADQAAIIVKGFSAYYKIDSDPKVKKEILHLCNGIIKMQAGDNNKFPYNAFLSWQNTWHMWGNSQADALIEAGDLFRKPQYIKYAMKEIYHFYPYLMHLKYLNNFAVEKKSGIITFKDSTRYSQIAYGIRPMVFACIRLSKAARDKKSAELAGNIACWLLGKNISGEQMYDPKTGVCYDGIENETSINKNSGAESTIEALLTLITIEQNKTAKDLLLRYYQQNKNTKNIISGEK